MDESPDRSRRAAWLMSLVFAGYWLLLFASTHVPRDFPLLPGEGTDKLVHMSAFLGLAALFAASWELSVGRLKVQHLIVIWLIVAVYAVVDEFSQPPFGRSCSIWDWVADMTGVGCGLLLFLAWRRWRT